MAPSKTSPASATNGATWPGSCRTQSAPAKPSSVAPTAKPSSKASSPGTSKPSPEQRNTEEIQTTQHSPDEDETRACNLDNSTEHCHPNGIDSARLLAHLH